MHKTMRSLLFLFLIAISTFIVGCGSSVPVIKPFKLDIQQGNVVTSKMLLQLRPGMTKSQVKFIMGTPLVIDSFHTNRWDYFYQMRQAGKVIEQRRVILDFEKELLSRVRGDVVPQGTQGADTGAVTLSTESANAKKTAPKEGLLENLKFWKSRETEVVKPVAPAELVKPKSTTKAKPSESSKQTSPVVVPETVPEAAATDNTVTDSAVTDTEAPSMLAVPIEIAPAADTVKQTPTPEAQTTPAPAPGEVNQEDRFIFRMERELHTKELENTPAPQNDSKATAKPVVNTNKTQENLPPEEEPGYFERMLEKIGF